MKNNNKGAIFGLFFLLGGLITALGPVFIFPACEDMGDKHMKCFWTMKAEIGVGALIAVLGILIILISSVEIRRGLILAAGISFLNVLLIPDVLIGVCGGNHMQCRTLTLPALNIIGVIGIVIGGLGFFFLKKNTDQAKEGKI